MDEALRTALGKLFAGAGHDNDRLLRCIEAYEREPALLDQLLLLKTENERLKEQIRKLRGAAHSKENMSSKLREALRE